MSAPCSAPSAGPRGALRQHLLEQVAERRRPLGVHAAREIEAGEAERLGVVVGVAAGQLAGVVAAPAIRIDQRLVGVEHLAKARRRLAVARIDVRMKPARESPIRPLDVAAAGAAVHAEDDVEIHVGHRIRTSGHQLFLLVLDHFRVDDVAFGLRAAARRRTCGTAGTRWHPWHRAEASCWFL